jgi:hypothetical protein
MRIVGYNPNRYTSLVQKESPSLVECELIDNYSESSFVELLDQRNGGLRGHYFEPRNLYKIHNVILEPKQGILYTPSGYLIEESTSWSRLSQYNSFPWNLSGHLSKMDFEEALFITSNSYGHWLIEDLALTISTMAQFPNSPIICLKNPPKYVSDFLATASHQVIYVDGPIQIKSLIMISKGVDSGWVHPQDFNQLVSYPPFKQAMNMESITQKVYASRIGLKRSPSNEMEIESLFKSMGYESLHLEDLGLLQEISLISGLTHLAGVHGSTFVNQVWMNDGQNVIELTNKNFWTEMCLDYLTEIPIKKRTFTYSGSANSPVPIPTLKEFLLQSDNHSL